MIGVYFFKQIHLQKKKQVMSIQVTVQLGTTSLTLKLTSPFGSERRVFLTAVSLDSRQLRNWVLSKKSDQTSYVHFFSSDEGG